MVSKTVPEMIVAVEAVKRRTVLHRGRVGKIIGVDPKTGAAIVKFPHFDNETLALEQLEVMQKRA